MTIQEYINHCLRMAKQEEEEIKRPDISDWEKGLMTGWHDCHTNVAKHLTGILKKGGKS